MSRRQDRADRRAIAVGLAATVIVVAMYARGDLDRLELRTLDLRFMYANPVQADARIACVDIDDGALKKVGRWPWPRDVQAGMLALLAELGAKAVLYDVTLTEPEPVRTIVPEQADIAFDPLELAAGHAVEALPDEELRVSLARAGIVYLAFDYTTMRRAGGRAADDLRTWIRDWLNADEARWGQRVHVLFKEVCATLAERSDVSAPAQPAEIALALREVLSRAATVRDGFCPPENVWLTAVAEISPVYFPLARAAKRCGFVVFEPDVDGVMRRMRLFVQYDGRVLPQLACAVGLDESGWKPAGATKNVFRSMQFFDDGSRRRMVQIDGEGRVLVPWLPERKWTQQFGPHVPIDALWQVYDRRLSIQHNEELVADLLGQLLAAGELSEHEQYADDLKQVLRLRSELRLARYRDDANAVRQNEAWLAEYQMPWQEGQARLRAALPELARGGGGPEHVEALWTLEQALAANDGYRVEIEATLDKLRPRIEGRLCMVGYTATSLADMTPIPTNSRAPGVIAHASLLNGLLTGRTVRWAPTWLNALLALLAGMLASITSVRREQHTAAIIALVLAGTVAAGSVALFYLRMYWLAVTPAILSVAASYVLVLLYRYIFLERESRQIATALGQYTSATLARKMAEDAELCRRAETREVTAVFTDLANFTSISERIGAERTQRVLNTSLGRFCDVMLRYEGMINKFIGDGIFAFWNPVIYPQADHARRACETAVDLMAALRGLIAEQHGAHGDEVFGELVLRIGVATGNAVVGPCGSEQKYDYTCIGDSVNVAARLESANKFYGTHILISGPTYAQAGGGFVVRALGGVRVKGKTQTVPIYELLGRTGDVADDLVCYAERFGVAVTAFQECAWDAALAAFQGCLGERPDDLAARQYVEAVRRYSRQPPPADWSGALELTEK